MSNTVEPGGPDDSAGDGAPVQVMTVELGHKPQDDFTFDVSGEGGPITEVKLGCNSAVAPKSTCGLEPTFTILSNYAGVISPKVCSAAAAPRRW